MSSLRAEGLGKSYRLYARPLDSLKEWALRRPYHTPFWALRDVSFEVPVGGTFGVVGSNGAGKTTLLKILAGTIKPSAGSLGRRGRVSALLELGSGFHPDLTGRENLRLGCAVMGLSPSETAESEPEIIDFSELGDFIDRPVKTFSTGMYMRLAFSVATAVDPDILVVDEALSVGDQHFQKKCLDRLTAFRKAGRTLVFCSHEMYFVSRLCTQTLWLRSGRTEALGDTHEVVQAYQDYERRRGGDGQPPIAEAPTQPTVQEGPEGEGGQRPDEPREARFDTPAKTTWLDVVELEGGGNRCTITTGSRLAVRATARVAPSVGDDVSMAVLIRRTDGLRVYAARTDEAGVELHQVGDRRGIRVVFDELPLLAGEYEVDVFLLNAEGLHPYDERPGAVSVTVRHARVEVGLVRIPHRWEAP